MCSADVLSKNNILRDAKHLRMEQEDALYSQPSCLQWLSPELARCEQIHLSDMMLADHAVATFALWNSGKMGKEPTE